MEAIFIAGIVGFISGGMLIFVIREKIGSTETKIYDKLDQLHNTTISAARELAQHITGQTKVIVDKIEPAKDA